MKNKVNIWVLTICLGVLLSISAYGQYVPHTVYVGLKDYSLLPKGYTQDSIVITNNHEIDSIFILYGVKSMRKVYTTYTFHNMLDSLYVIYCDSSEIGLCISLNKYNSLYNNKKFLNVFLISIGYDNIPDFQLTKTYQIYPNPITDNLTIENNNPEDYNMQLYKINGQAVYSENGIATNSLTLDTQNWEKGVYYIVITNKTEHIVKKIIKN